jgi:lysophospholipase L1-like esterase
MALLAMACTGGRTDLLPFGQSKATSPTGLTLLALGDSITHGFGDDPGSNTGAASHYDGYRPALFAALSDGGLGAIAFIGSHRSGTFARTAHHEGVDGATIEDKLATIEQLYGEGRPYEPNVFLIEIGTNDHAAQFATGYPTLLRELHAAVPGAQFVVVALGHGAVDLAPNNAALPGIWDTLEREGLELHRAYPASPPMEYPGEYCRDGVHPNAAGYVHYAHLLSPAVIEALNAVAH